MDSLRDELGENAFREGRFEEAIGLFSSLVFGSELDAFLTLSAYELIA